MGTKASGEPLGVVVASRDVVARHGLRSILAELERVEALAADPDDLAAVLEGGPDAVVVDETLTSEEVAALAEAGRVIVTFAAPTDAAVLSAFASGVVGVVSQAEGTASLAESIAAVGRGQFYIDASLAHVLVERAVTRPRPTGPFGLTVRERRIVTLLGCTNREIGAHLGISPETVKSHVRNLLRKLGARDRHHAAEIARQNGLD